MHFAADKKGDFISFVCCMLRELVFGYRKQDKNRHFKFSLTCRGTRIYNKLHVETYRSGCNEPHSKCGCPKGHVGSNPTVSVIERVGGCHIKCVSGNGSRWSVNVTASFHQQPASGNSGRTGLPAEMKKGGL